MFITPLWVLCPVEMDVAVEAESGANDVESNVVADPATGKFINERFFPPLSTSGFGSDMAPR